MAEIESDFFQTEKMLIDEARKLIVSEEHNEKVLLEKYSIIIEQFEKLIKDVEKIIRISDGQQEYLHKIQRDLKKEIEDRIRAEEKLKYFAAIDTLTGCYNRGMGLNLLESEIKSVRRNNGNFSLCYIDLNGLKYVNDNFGHSEGDEFIIITCKFIKDVVRDNDILCRMGGDEFIILFPNLKKEVAEEFINKILSNIDIENKKELRPYNISFSYGIVQIDYDNNRGVDEIIQMADEKMYKHKKNIRN